jgi:soluble lytic murein transglycosylase-like protein
MSSATLVPICEFLLVKVLRTIVVKHLLVSLLLSCLLGEYCLAEEIVSDSKGSAVEATQVVDYEKHVREIAQKTAEEAKARKAQERLDRAKTSSLNLVPSANTAANTTSTANKTVSSTQIVSGSNSIAAQSSTPSSKPSSFTNVAKSSVADTGGFRVFKYRKDGSTMFADSAPYKTKYEVVIYNSCYACSITSSVNWYNTRLRLSEFADTINVVSKQYGVNPGFVRAIIHAESAFNPIARSRKGAMGLMQLMPGTAKDMGVMDLTNPEQNIKGGVRYLAGLLKTFSGNETLAAAAYNAGPGAVTRYGGIPPYEETQTYVKRVKILADRYKNQPQLAVN